MNKLSFKTNSNEPSEMADVDIDVTPIMNMFIILIPFLVSMAVFTKLAILEFQVPANSGSSLSKGTPKLKMTMVLNSTSVKITQGADMLDSIGLKDGVVDEKLLKDRLLLLDDKITIKNEAVLAVSDSVEFETIVSVMDICKSSGYEKIGISSSVE